MQACIRAVNVFTEGLTWEDFMIPIISLALEKSLMIH